MHGQPPEPWVAPGRSSGCRPRIWRKLIALACGAAVEPRQDWPHQAVDWSRTNTGLGACPPIPSAAMRPRSISPMARRTPLNNAFHQSRIVAARRLPTRGSDRRPAPLQRQYPVRSKRPHFSRARAEVDTQEERVRNHDASRAANYGSVTFCAAESPYESSRQGGLRFTEDDYNQ